jgi:hypothetical protein
MMTTEEYNDKPTGSNDGRIDARDMIWARARPVRPTSTWHDCTNSEGIARDIQSDNPFVPYRRADLPRPEDAARIAELEAQLAGGSFYQEKDIDRMQDQIAELKAHLSAIIARWDTPAWKDAEPTGEVINRARAALKGAAND